MSMRRRLILAGVAAVLVVAAAGVIGIVLRERSHPRFWPTDAELSEPGRADRLIGTWTYLGSILMVADDAILKPPQLRDHIRTFWPSGTGRERYFTDSDPSWEIFRWKISQGRLHERGRGYESWAQFFFRDGKLYIEGNSSWDVYQRR